MARPDFFGLTDQYFAQQTERVLSTLDRIVQRPAVGDGRVIPSPEDIGIHDGRRINATVLFIDICGFSRLPSSAPDEQEVVLKVLALFFSEMIRIVEDHGGSVEKNTGDGLMAYFSGADTSGVGPEQRGLCSTLTMFAAVERLINPILERSGFPALRFRACLDHGIVTIAKLGAPKRFNAVVAIGTPANLAAKMLELATPDTILIGDNLNRGLPQSWSERFSVLETIESGFLYKTSGRPYPVWRYQGRWTKN